jgi:hypothetical protein
MEAMSIESMLLSLWEEEHFVGKTRVPVGQSDVDVLALRVRDKRVRIGEAKIREGSRRVYLLDDSSLARMNATVETDFTNQWLEPSWQRWLSNLPELWTHDGAPVVPWLPQLVDAAVVEVWFVCNLNVLADRGLVNKSFQRGVERHLRKNKALASRLDANLRVEARVVATIEVVFDLIKQTCERIGDGYGRRFGDPIKDMIRELRRYLHAEIDRLQYDASGNAVDSSRAVTRDKTRNETVKNLLAAFGITELDLPRLAGN